MIKCFWCVVRLACCSGAFLPFQKSSLSHTGVLGGEWGRWSVFLIPVRGLGSIWPCSPLPFSACLSLAGKWAWRHPELGVQCLTHGATLCPARCRDNTRFIFFPSPCLALPVTSWPDYLHTVAMQGVAAVGRERFPQSPSSSAQMAHPAPQGSESMSRGRFPCPAFSRLHGEQPQSVSI